MEQVSRAPLLKVADEHAQAAQKAKLNKAESDATLKQVLARKKQSEADLAAAIEKARKSLEDLQAMRSEKHALEESVAEKVQRLAASDERARRAEAQLADSGRDSQRQLNDEKALSRSRKQQLDELQGRFDELQRNYQLLQSLQSVRVCVCWLVAVLACDGVVWVAVPSCVCVLVCREGVVVAGCQDRRRVISWTGDLRMHSWSAAVARRC